MAARLLTMMHLNAPRGIKKMVHTVRITHTVTTTLLAFAEIAAGVPTLPVFLNRAEIDRKIIDMLYDPIRHQFTGKYQIAYLESEHGRVTEMLTDNGISPDRCLAINSSQIDARFHVPGATYLQSALETVFDKDDGIDQQAPIWLFWMDLCGTWFVRKTHIYCAHKKADVPRNPRKILKDFLTFYAAKGTRIIINVCPRDRNGKTIKQVRASIENIINGAGYHFGIESNSYIGGTNMTKTKSKAGTPMHVFYITLGEKKTTL